MKHLLRLFVLLPFLIVANCSFANDGAFKGSGNQLVPMYESDISVKKEILTIKRTSANKAEITVYYEFFNPKEAKELEVGFEAFSPMGDVDSHPVKGQHPYITHFTVNLNGNALPFSVAIVKDSLYYRNGKYKSLTLTEALKEADEFDYPDFFYVYHFKAAFKNGINIIKHTYTIDLSSSVSENYSLQYVLTAAKRWANRQIDDFTLQVDVGSFQSVSIDQTFFSNASEWQVPGSTKVVDRKANKANEETTGSSAFFIRNGVLTFQKMNFKPAGEFYMQSANYYSYFYGREDGRTSESFDSKYDPLPFSIENDEQVGPPANDLSKRVLRNLPFARRGYVFKSPELQSYYDRQPWYVKDETYAPVVEKLTKQEQSWLSKL